MEEKKLERDLMSQEEFKEYLEEGKKNRTLVYFVAVSKYKSVKRAIRRGLVEIDGTPFPKRPFNNRANNSNRKGKHSRNTNQLKKQIYGQLKYNKTESI